MAQMSDKKYTRLAEAERTMSTEVGAVGTNLALMDLYEQTKGLHPQWDRLNNIRHDLAKELCSANPDASNLLRRASITQGSVNARVTKFIVSLTRTKTGKWIGASAPSLEFSLRGVKNMEDATIREAMLNWILPLMSEIVE